MATSSCGTGGRGGSAEGDDPLAAVETGDLHFDLDGEKLAGRFVLVRRGAAAQQWLLIKKHDEAAAAGWEPGEHPRSVKSGRTNDEVRDAPAARWSSGVMGGADGRRAGRARRARTQRHMAVR